MVAITSVCPPVVMNTKSASKFKNCDTTGVEPTVGWNAWAKPMPSDIEICSPANTTAGRDELQRETASDAQQRFVE